MKKTLLLSGVAALVAFNANAFDWKTDLSPYIGADYNFTKTHHPESTKNIERGVLPGNFHSGTFAFGANVLSYGAVEGFAEFYKYQNKGKARSYSRAYGVDVLGFLPLYCNEWELVGSLGLGRYYNKLKYREGGNKSEYAEYDWGYRLGVGVQYNLNDNWTLRGMYRHVIFNKPKFAYTNLDVISVGVRYNF